jgi:DNA-3-methyladenine glycosylase
VTLLGRDFFEQPTLQVAQTLLGQYLIREIEGQRLVGRIVETEAYIGPEDTACHASKGYTPRTAVMFGPPAHAYVYLIYGMYYMLNLVTEREGFPAAALIRAVEPLEGLEMMQSNRHRKSSLDVSIKNLTNGPGKLCQAFAIDKALNNWDVSRGEKLWLEKGKAISELAFTSGPRIGIDYAHLSDRTAPWRFWLKDSRFVSK